MLADQGRLQNSNRMLSSRTGIDEGQHGRGEVSRLQAVRQLSVLSGHDMGAPRAKFLGVLG